MTAVAWAIIVYTICAFPNVELEKASGNFVLVAITIISLLTIKDFFK